MDHLENIPDDFESPAEEGPPDTGEPATAEADAAKLGVRTWSESRTVGESEEAGFSISDESSTVQEVRPSDLPTNRQNAELGEIPAAVSENRSQQPDTQRSPTVGVFDSGIGGFTVASAILKRRPDLNLVYYADSLNLPYGGREQAQLERFAGNIIEFLLARRIDILADGCNTSQSALSSGELRSHPIPAYDLVTCTIEALRDKRRPQCIAVLATEATVRAGWWERRLCEAFSDIPVRSVAAPQLVPLIEAQQQDEHALRHAVGKYIREVRETGADTVVLGCTHYPLVQPLMMETDVYLRYVDPAQCLADKVAADLAVGVAPARPSSAGREASNDISQASTVEGQTRINVGTIEEGRAGATPTYTGTLQFFNSRPSERFYAMGERVFGREIRSLTKMYIVNPYED